VIGSCRVAPLQQQVRVAMVTGAETPTDARRLLGLLQPTEMLVKVVVSARSARQLDLLVKSAHLSLHTLCVDV